MANNIRALDFLPEIFQTPVNEQFLNATLDQLIQEPRLKKSEGYIGRKIGPGVSSSDSYVVEPTNARNNYQLEPGVTFLKPQTSTATGALTFPGIVDSLGSEGAITTRYDRLFNSEFYAWDPMVDFDKFVNFGQYFWLPSGPDSVDVFATDIPLTDDFTVTRTSTDYTFSGEPGKLPTITLARQGNYTFEVNQPGNEFYIQVSPGVDGTLPFSDRSGRDVLGVTNNGEDQGTVTFNVPEATAQDFYLTLVQDGTVDLVTSLQLDDINNQRLSTFLATNGGIDGIEDLRSRTLVFLEQRDGLEGGWTLDGSTEITDDATKYAVWQINYSADADPILSLSVVREVANLKKMLVNYGTEYASTFIYKNASGYYEQVPLITANLDTLYYQDGTEGNIFGVIRLVDQPTNVVLNVNDILSSSEYTSPNGVTFTNGLKVQFEGLTNPATYSGNEYYVEGVGTQITLHAVTDFITPESYTQSETVPFDSVGFDIGGFDDSLNAPTSIDYITINRASIDKNAWTRSNRWFHIDVINATATYNNTVAVLNNNNRARRPILEFRENLKLYNNGIQGIDPVNILDFTEGDAFSNVNGSIGYNIDSYQFTEGTKVIFANDQDPVVRNKVYVVHFVAVDDSSDPIIDLQPADINSPGVSVNQSVLSISGATQQGSTFYYDGTNWIKSQQKTGVNQTPLFDIFDANGYSYGDTTVYPSTTFRGTKLFSYALGTGTADPILGQALQYLSINNVGDIVFDNNFYTDTFVYVDGTTSTTKNISEGFARQYSALSTFNQLIGWQTSHTEVTSRQIFTFEYEGNNLVLDIEVDATSTAVPVKVFINDDFVIPNKYTYSTNLQGVTEISFVTSPDIGDIINVSAVSKTASKVAYYEVAYNLENNAVNENNEKFTLGTVRNHYNSICQNQKDFIGQINGANNLRDLGNTVPYGGFILQQSSPLTFASTFLYNQEINFFDAIGYNGYEYEKTKNLILNEVANNEWSGYLTSAVLDQVLDNINIGKNENSPFYWTDTLPSGETFEETVYTYSAISDNVFDTLYSYDFTSANYQGILVYLNDVILSGDGHDYTVATDGPRITINTDKITLSIGDKIKIREYTTTYGNFVPATPATLGLSKVYEPEKFLDNTYTTPTDVIRGHDGSLTVAFGDIRDDVLLEFETRIYSNIKVANRYNAPIDNEDVIPGQFRTTDYTLTEINSLLSESFLRWAGTNKINYTSQTYDASNEFTWNYSKAQNKLDGSILLGGWRGIYFDLYDTDSPHTRPWEMLGLTEEPTWWQDQYGPAPYTSGNLILWRDLRDGKLADPDGAVVYDQFKRPQLLDIIPVDSAGNLLSPFQVVVGNYDQNSFQKSWVFGDQGPQETVWRRSSSYVFALQKLFAQTQPAKYFALLSDIDLYTKSTEFNQYLYNGRYRIDSKNIVVYGPNTSKHSYINFIVDYNQTRGLNASTLIESILDNLNIQLCYRMASFSDKRYIKLFSEKSSPNSENASLLLPDESYQLVLYKNPVFQKVNWSSIVIQKTATGYQVNGYDTTRPYFEIYKSKPNGSYVTIDVNGTVIRIAEEFSDTLVRVPYGYEFSTVTGVCDFLVSYGQYLTAQGIIFDAQDNNIILTWLQMAREFVYWSNQGWDTGSLINLNPAADKLVIDRENSVVDSLLTSQILNQNNKTLTTENYITLRAGNKIELRSQNNDTFAFAATKFVSYEHMIILDNTSIFNDLLYQPITGARQYRLLIDAYKTFDWNGTLNAEGFILNQDNVGEWVPNRAYSKGEIVLYKDSYWSASKLLPPAETFTFADWIKSDYQKISKGLLPNIATKSDLIRNFYDTQTANLETDADNLAFGLIGFRPRQYMENLNLDDISQVNLYKQFISTKGTTRATDIFSSANLNKEVAEYDIFENWAIRRAMYGANANRSYYELKLDESKMLANPSTIAVIDVGDPVQTDQQVLIKDIYKQSYQITDKNILPQQTASNTDLSLPSAGYVNWDDADIKVFDFSDLGPIINNISQILVGTSIWVAKSNPYDWNIYRNNLVLAELVQVRDNLNGTSTLTFSGNHSLSKDQIIVIKYFDQIVDGSYQVLNVPSLKTVTVSLGLTDNTVSLTGIGIVFVLESVRLKQPSDIANLSFANNLLPGNKAWIDNNGNDQWAIYKKENPFGTLVELGAATPVIDNQFGQAIAQGMLNQGALIGAPGYNSNAGGVYAYNKTAEPTFNEITIIAPGATSTTAFGSSIDVGDSSWGVSGASQSLSSRGYAFTIYRESDNGQFFLRQCLVESTTTSGSEFGYDVTVSADERWMYVSAIGDDTIYCYNKVTVQPQSLTFTGDGITTNFTISDTIILDDDSADGGIASQQINVVKNGFPTTANVDWVYSDGVIAFTTPPNIGDVVKVNRKTSILTNATSPIGGFTVEDIYPTTDIYSFSITDDGVLLRPYLDYTFDTSTKLVSFTVDRSGAIVTTCNDHWKLVTTISNPPVDSASLATFGYSIDTTTDGRQITIGSPFVSSTGEINGAGKVYLYDRSVERFQITDATDRTYTTLRAPTGPVTVKLNNQFLQPTPFNNNGQYTVAGSIVTLNSSVTLTVGDILEIETNTFKLTQTIESNNVDVNTHFGKAIEQCMTNCSLYIGKPNDSTLLPEAGSVERWLNQNRIFGTLTNSNAYPILHPGDTIRINNYDVAVVNPPAWTSARTWDSGDFVLDGGGVYIALQDVPISTALGDTDYWAISNWAQSFAADINDANIPNVVANYANGKITLSLQDVEAGDEFIKLIVLPGLGGAWTALGFKPLVYAQTINPPVAYDYGHFGESLAVSDDSLTLVVGSPDGASQLPTVFENNTTTFDAAGLQFLDNVQASGVVYTYDFLPSANSTPSNPGKFVFGQQIFDKNVGENDRFGTAVSYSGGTLLSGAPGSDLEDSVGNYGVVSIVANGDNSPSWKIEYAQQPVVDIQMLNGAFIYNKRTSEILSDIDYIDPLYGKILGSVQQNLDYILGLDPASYNVGGVNNTGQIWGQAHVGEIWWDTSTCRFIDYHQDSDAYKARRWGQLFPGSSIDLWQWIESSVPPENYNGPGTVKNTTSYNVGSQLNADGLFRNVYYFWVKGIQSVAQAQGKTLSTSAMAQYIENPATSGISYLAPISQSTVALFNCRNLISATDSILHIEFDKIKNDDNVHVEYDLIAQNDPNSFIGSGLYRKLQDSFCGADTVGNIVPDVTLSPADAYGTSYRPRQSLFVNRFKALENYLVKANSIMAQFPIAEIKQLNLLKSQAPEPTSASNEWDKRVLTYAELTYQNLQEDGIAYRYLVASDETNSGLWTIYTIQDDYTLLLTRVQNYDTNQFWSYVDWVKPGYNASIRPVAEVASFNEIAQLTGVLEGQSVKVTANSFGKSEIFQLTNGEYIRVLAEDSTVAIDQKVWNYSAGRYGFDENVWDAQRFDENPILETRQIIRSLNEEIFTGDQLIYRNELLVLMFNYILTEQTAPNWLFKTSLVDVSHKIRDLIPFAIYRSDNQDFVLDYIKEVKPYHVKIKEFSLRYDGNDVYQGNLTDFDIPAYYNTDFKAFISPQLNGPEVLSNGETNISRFTSDEQIWTEWPWSQWYNNYTLSLNSVTVVEGGSGYTVPPQVTVTGTATVLPTLQARINTAGEVIEIEVLAAGSGYTTTPVITISGGNGTGAVATPVMQNQMVRSFDTTLKFDRYEYATSVQTWQKNTDYAEGSLVRYNNKVYSVNEVADSTELDSGDEFIPEFYTEVDQSTLTGVDRIMGLYQPTVNQPGLQLSLLINGIDYPGVQVDGPNFNQNTGFDVGNFDINVFDNLDFGPEGAPTYSDSILDVEYSSAFTDTYLGTRTTDINVDGSEFIDTYSSHAPEELVPGSNFDTLDLRVISNPGADWTSNGHGFNIKSQNYVASGSTLTVDWSTQMRHAVAVSVENLSTGINLNALQNFTVNWPAKTVTVSSGISANDDVRVRTFGVGGGNQLFRQTYNGANIGNSLTINVDYDEIIELFIVVNGIQTTAFTFAAGTYSYQTDITFSTTYTSSDLITVVALGTTTPQKSWSTPRGEYFQYDGSTLQFTLSESLQGTNPIDLVVFQDGKRIRPPESIEYTGDGSSAGPYYIPTRGQIPQGLISDNDVKVYVDNEEQFLAVDWTLTPWDGSSDRYVAFNIAPDSGAKIKIAVTTYADYDVDGSVLTLRTNPAGDAIINVVTFNDTSEQDILTQVFVGPTETGTVVQVPFDSVDFDSGDYDSTTGIVLATNDLATGRTITNSDRIEVHKNGFRLANGEGFTTTTAGIVTIGGSILGPSDVITITSFTMAVTPEEMEFRIFQDMLGNQKIYRITPNNTTQLSRALGATDDTIYVDDVTKLSPTDISENILGQVIINGERITYRTRNTSNNTLTGLRRGIAGTAATSHAVDSTVTDMGIGEQLPLTYQKQTTSNTFTGDGTNKKFVATNISLEASLDSTEIEEVIRVNVGGAELAQSAYTVTQLNPVEVTLTDAPGDGVEVVVSIVRSNVMYAQGVSTASNGIALQEQTTAAARFIRGEI